MPTASDYIIRLPLPESLIAVYEKEAERSGKTLEEFLVQHLRKARALLAQEKPLIVMDADRRRIEVALAKGFNDGSHLADSCERLSALNIGGVEINLSERCIERLHTRCYGTTFEDFLQQIVPRLIEIEVGLR